MIVTSHALASQLKVNVDRKIVIIKALIISNGEHSLNKYIRK